MSKKFGFLFLVITIALLDSLAYAGELSAAKTVANHFIKAVASGDTKTISGLFTSHNQQKVPAGTPKFESFLAEARKDLGGITEIVEFRKGPEFMADKGAVSGKIRVVGGEVLVLVLVKEGADFRVEDINSPDIARYEAMPILTE